MNNDTHRKSNTSEYSTLPLTQISTYYVYIAKSLALDINEDKINYIHMYEYIRRAFVGAHNVLSRQENIL